MAAHNPAKAAALAKQFASEAAEARDDRGAAFFLYHASRALTASGAWGESVECAARSRQLAMRAAPTIVSPASQALAAAYYVSEDFTLARKEAEVMLRFADPRSPNVSMRTLMSAILTAAGDDREGQRYAAEAVQSASIRGSPEDLALARNEFGVRSLERGDLEEAEENLLDAFRIRIQTKSPYLAQSYHNVGRLLHAQGRLEQAVTMFEMALRSDVTEAIPVPWIHYRLALARAGQKQNDNAIGHLMQAAGAIRQLRLDYPFANDTQVRSEVRFQEIYDQLLQLAVPQFQSGGRLSIDQAFDLTQENRAASLVLRADTADSWRRKLPEDYFAKLAKLRALEAEAIRTRETPGPELLSLRADLAAAETRSGLETAAHYNTPPAERRARLDRALAEGEILVSFHLGTPKSYAFVLRNGSVTVRTLGPKQAIAARVDQFRKSIEKGSGEVPRQGAALYRELFGALPRDGGLLTIVPDDVLYGLPFAALAIDDSGTYLAQKYAIRVAPSAFFFGGRKPHPRPLRFAGVGDPVFNKADPRWQGARLAVLTETLLSRPRSAQLARLVSSEAEVRESARAWDQSRLLLGREVEIPRIEQAIRESPGILHVATHMLRRAANVSPSIALGLDTAGKLKVWTAADIAALEYAPEFVTLSGCGSGQGPALRGAGLLGLTRSWLMAGSRAVVASYWPVPEESHRLFATYYKALQELENEPASSRRAARALQRTQIEAIANGGWQADPRYWSAYFVIGAL